MTEKDNSKLKDEILRYLNLRKGGQVEFDEVYSNLKIQAERESILSLVGKLVESGFLEFTKYRVVIDNNGMLGGNLKITPDGSDFISHNSFTSEYSRGTRNAFWEKVKSIGKWIPKLLAFLKGF